MSEGRFFRIPAQEKTVIRDINEEIEFHIEERVASLVAEGLASDEARGLA
jgi:hypothetical protein